MYSKGQIFGEITEDKKPLIAIHGYLDNSNSFKPIALHLTDNTQYYIIAIDLPGMGLSSKLPDGIPYSLKLFVMNIHKVVKHFNLNKFTFLTHSLGCSIALSYSACYKDNILGLCFIDFALKECDIKLKENLAEVWRDGIEKFTDFEVSLKGKKQSEKEITYEYALSRLLQANSHIDELAAKILLERGLSVSDEGKYEYSRDIRLVTSFSIREYQNDFILIYHSLKDFNIPVNFIYATPPPYGDLLFDQIKQMVSHLRENSQSTVDFIPIEGTHHFHMLKPAEASLIVLKFLEEKVCDLIAVFKV